MTRQRPEAGTKASLPRRGLREERGPAFSAASLARISGELALIEHKNPFFSCSVSPDRLQASEGYGQGIDVSFSDGAYRVVNYRERSVDAGTVPDEEAAVARFISYCRFAKRADMA